MLLSAAQFDHLNRLVKDFEPFRNLWITVSDWLRWHESWMNDPLTSIDAELVEKNVAESYKTMHKSVKLFQDIPSAYRGGGGAAAPSLPLLPAVFLPAWMREWGPAV